MTHAVKRIVAVAIISTVAMISAAAQRALAPDNRETAVRAALTRFLTAFENLDWDAFRASFNDDVTVFFPMPEPPQRSRDVQPSRHNSNRCSLPSAPHAAVHRSRGLLRKISGFK